MEFERRKDAKLALERLRWNKCWLIQAVWRIYVAKRDVERQRVRNREDWEMRMGSATKIQVRYRSYRCRTVLSNKVRDRKESIVAATYVQSCWRARLAWLEVETKRQIWLAEQESKAALIMQRAWRRKAAQKLIEMMKEEKKRMVRERQKMAGMLQRWWRGVIARREAAELKKQYLAQLRRMADLENWGSTIIAAAWRGKGGRDLARERMWQRKSTWKEMWSDEVGVHERLIGGVLAVLLLTSFGRRFAASPSGESQVLLQPGLRGDQVPEAPGPTGFDEAPHLQQLRVLRGPARVCQLQGVLLPPVLGQRALRG